MLIQRQTSRHSFFLDGKFAFQISRKSLAPMCVVPFRGKTVEYVPQLAMVMWF